MFHHFYGSIIQYQVGTPRFVDPQVNPRGDAWVARKVFTNEHDSRVSCSRPEFKLYVLAAPEAVTRDRDTVSERTLLAKGTVKGGSHQSGNPNSG